MTKAELKEKTGGVLLDVLITEKGAKLSEQGRYMLEVAPDARKPAIAAAASRTGRSRARSRRRSTRRSCRWRLRARSPTSSSPAR